jgi:hypothetical protein
MAQRKSQVYEIKWGFENILRNGTWAIVFHQDVNDRKVFVSFLQEKYNLKRLKGKDHSEDLGVDGKIVCNLGK